MRRPPVYHPNSHLISPTCGCFLCIARRPSGGAGGPLK